MAIETYKAMYDELQAIESEADRLILDLYRELYKDEADPVRFGGAEFVDEQQVIHRISPAHTGEEAKVADGERRETALRFHLAEARGVRRDHDVGREHHLDADRVGDALDDGDDAENDPQVPSEPTGRHPGEGPCDLLDDDVHERPWKGP